MQCAANSCPVLCAHVLSLLHSTAQHVLVHVAHAGVGYCGSCMRGMRLISTMNGSLCKMGVGHMTHGMKLPHDVNREVTQHAVHDCQEAETYHTAHQW